MKKIITSIFIFLIATSLWPYDFKIGDLEYRIVDSLQIPYSVEVCGADSMITFADIPSSVINAEDTFVVVGVASSTFKDCDSLRSVAIPGTIKYIEERAFHNTPVYKDKDNWHDGVLYVDDCIIEGKNISSIDYIAPQGTRLIADKAFEESPLLKYVIVVRDSGVLVGNDASPKNIQSEENSSEYSEPDNMDESGVDILYAESIVDNLVLSDSVLVYVLNKDTITSIDIPDDIKVIGRGALAYCNALATINLPNDLVSIEESAFMGCSSLNSIKIPKSVSYIGSNAFFDCINLKTAYIYNEDIILEDNSFVGCSASKTFTDTIIGNLVIKNNRIVKILSPDTCTSLVVPDCVTSIDRTTFVGCSSLSTITLPGSVAHIGGGTFSNFTALKTVNMSEGIRWIDLSAFSGCSALEHINIPQGIEVIGPSAFANCLRLSSIELPEGISTIGDKAFSGCASIRSITIPASTITIGNNVFENCDSLTSIIVLGNERRNLEKFSQEHVDVVNADQVIEQYVLKDRKLVYVIEVSKYTIINVPDEVTSIGDSVFLGCSEITSISLPNSVTSIGEKALSNCTALTHVNIPTTLTHIGEEAFSGCSSLASITVPSSVTRMLL